MFATFVNLLHRTADARSARGYVQARLANVLTAMKKDAALRAIGFTVAFDVLDAPTCHDRTALGLQEIELAIKTHELGNPSIPELIDLGKQYFRLNVIEEAAKEAHQFRQEVGQEADFGEILIAFQTRVKDEFDLPIDTETMAYYTNLYASEAEIESAKKSVAEKEDSQELVEFLTQFRPLQEELKRSSPDRFNDLQKSFEEREEALSIIPEGWSEGKYMEETKALKVDKEAAEQALYRTLTHEAVERERGRGPEIRAKNQYNRGNRLRGLGWNEAALKPTRDAVGRYRELVTTSPDAFRPDLAKSLRSLSDTLKAMSLGKRQSGKEAVEAMNLGKEAVEAGREAVEVYRELAAVRPDAFRPHLAENLGNLSKQLGAQNRHVEALEAGREAVELYRELAAARPDAFRSHLTSVYDNQRKMARARDRCERPLKAARKAVEGYRRLVEFHPTFRPQLVDSLDRLSKMFTTLDRHEEALEASREAVGVYRELAATHSASRPQLADRLDSLSTMFTALDRHEEALEALREAVGVYRELAATHSDSRPRLAERLGSLSKMLSALDRLSKMLSALDRHKEALEATREEVGQLRRLTDVDFFRFRLRLADSLDSLSRQLSALDLGKEAQQLVDEAKLLRAIRHPQETAWSARSDFGDYIPSRGRGDMR